jgi:hypothetical protein
VKLMHERLHLAYLIELLIKSIFAVARILNTRTRSESANSASFSLRASHRNQATLQRIYRINAFQVIEKADMLEIVQVAKQSGSLCIRVVFC